MSRWQSSTFQPRLADLEPRCATWGGGGARAWARRHPRDHRTDGVRPRVPVGGYLGTGGDGGRELTQSAISIASHGGKGRVLDGVISVPLPLHASWLGSRVVIRYEAGADVKWGRSDQRKHE